MGRLSFSIGTTPNPHAIRVGLSEPLYDKATTWSSATAADSDALARKLFAVAGVSRVFALGTFITVTKDPAADWMSVEPAVARVLAEHFDA